MKLSLTRRVEDSVAVCEEEVLTSEDNVVEFFDAAEARAALFCFTFCKIVHKLSSGGRYIRHNSTIQKTKKPTMPMHITKWKLVQVIFSLFFEHKAA